jgi:hypothetical protein
VTYGKRHTQDGLKLCTKRQEPLLTCLNPIIEKNYNASWARKIRSDITAPLRSLLKKDVT